MLRAVDINGSVMLFFFFPFSCFSGAKGRKICYVIVSATCLRLIVVGAGCD